MTDSLKAEDLIKELFENTLLDPGQFDQAVVQILKRHLSVEPIATKAGEKISSELEQLVKKRVAAKKVPAGEQNDANKS